jgi:two-component system response regulator YesN
MFSNKPLIAKSVKYSWLITYVILFLIPLLLCNILFVLVDGTIKDQVDRTNYFALKQIQQYMDSVVADAARIASSLAFNDRVQAIATFKGDISPKERYDIILLNRSMQSSNYKSEIEEVYIYFKRIDTVISSKHVMDSENFFDLFAERYGTDAAKWIKINQEMHRGSFVNITPQNKQLAYMFTYSINQNADDGINVVVIINLSNFYKMIDDLSIINNGNVAIIDENNRVILTSDNLDLMPLLKFDGFQNNSLTEYTSSDGKRRQVSCINSNMQGWKYLYIMPKDEYWKQLGEYRKLVLSGISFSLVVSCIVAFLLFKKNYEPIKRLLKSLKGHNEEDKGMINEYRIIQNAILRSLDDKKELEKWRAFQKKLLSERYLKELLTGNAAEQTDRDTAGIEFEHDCFAVAAFSADMEKPSTVLNLNLQEDIELLHFIIMNILEELLQDICKIYTVNFDNIIFCLMNFKEQDEKYMTKLKDAVTTVQETVKEHYKVNLIIAIGNIYNGKDFIKQSYKETRQLLEFEEIVGGEDILVYSEAKKFLLNENSHTYFYPPVMKDALVNAVKSGQYERIKNILDELFNYNLNNLTLSKNMAQCFKCDIIGTIINTLNSFINSNSQKYQSEIDTIERLIQSKNLNKVKEQLLIVLKDICEKINNERKGTRRAEDEIINYIRENYMDEELNVSTIADRFDLHPNYLSRLFKQQVGIGLLDYINMVRIEEAKKLLKSEYGNLETIARKVGYTNVKTFTRVFTKTEGITPGKYREKFN